jgi:general stress protein 26
LVPPPSRRLLRARLLPLAALAAGLLAGGCTRDLRSADPSSLEQAARELIAGARYGTLITLGPDGHPQARTIENLPPEADFSIWFATTPRTRKVEEIRRDPRVTFYWFDPARAGYVTLIGTARIVTDSAERARHWQPEWETFYPDRDRDYLLIQVQPRRLEVVSPAHGITGDSLTWRPPTQSFPPLAGTQP